MKCALFLALGLTTALTACFTRERVVERPVATAPATIVERPTVIERPAVVGSTAPACSYASQTYSAGAMSCQDHYQFRCNNGNWERTGYAC